MNLYSGVPSPFPTTKGLIDGSDLNKALAADASSVQSGLTALGATKATALQLTSVVSELSVVAAGTGVILPTSMVPGQTVVVFNNGANAVQVFAPGTITIDGVGAAGVPLTNAKRCLYTMVQPGVIISAQLGVVSA